MTVSISDLQGVYKEVYGDKLEQAVPDIAIATQDFPFMTSKKIGKDYHQPVILTNTQGVTFAAADAGAYTLNTPVGMNTRDAVVNGFQMTMREFIPYDTAEKAISGGPAAFISSVGLIMQNMKQSAIKFTETELLYGGTSLGETSSSANTNATTTVITLDADSYAVGIWTGSENARIDIYQSNGTTLINTTGACSITGVDIANRTLTITAAAADITAIDAYLAGANDAKIRWYGATGKEMIGLDYTLTTSGTVSNIDNTVYSLWQGNTYAVGGAMSVAKFLDAISLAFGKGGLNGPAQMYLPHGAWADLAAELTGNRRYDGSYSSTKGTNGTQTIEYYSQNGVTKITANPFVKAGEGFIFPQPKASDPGSLRRIGATDWTYNVAGKGEIFFNRQDENAFEVRMYTNQNFLNACPAKCVKLTGIS